MQSRSSRLLPRLSLLSTRSCSSPHLRTLTARLPLHPHSRKRWSPSSVCLRCFQPTTPTFVSCHSRPQCFSTSASPSPQPSPSSPPNFPSPSQTSRSALPPPPRMPPPPSFSNADNLQERNRRLLKYAVRLQSYTLPIYQRVAHPPAASDSGSSVCCDYISTLLRVLGCGSDLLSWGVLRRGAAVSHLLPGPALT